MAVPFVKMNFRSLLLKICDCLEYHEPTYDRVDVLKNIGVVTVATCTPPLAYQLPGKEMATFSESCEDAAMEMCLYLVRKYKILVFDINLELRLQCEKSIQLFQLRRNVLERIKEQLPPINNYGLDPIKGVEYGSNIVNIDFYQLLETVILKLKLKVWALQVVNMGDGTFVSWIIVGIPHGDLQSLPAVGDYCPCAYTAKQSMAKGAFELLRKVHTFDIVDINYFFLKSATLAYTHEQQMYMDVKDSLYGFKEPRNARAELEEDPSSPHGVQLKKLLHNNSPIAHEPRAFPETRRAFSHRRQLALPPPPPVLVYPKNEPNT